MTYINTDLIQQISSTSISSGINYLLLTLFSKRHTISVGFPLKWKCQLHTFITKHAMFNLQILTVDNFPSVRSKSE